MFLQAASSLGLEMLVLTYRTPHRSIPYKDPVDLIGVCFDCVVCHMGI